MGDLQPELLLGTFPSGHVGCRVGKGPWYFIPPVSTIKRLFQRHFIDELF